MAGLKSCEFEQLLEQVDQCSANERVEIAERLLGQGACRSLGIYRVPDDFMLSVIIPVYNELQTVAELVRRVRAVPIRKEIIIIDDFSTDGTRELLDSWPAAADLRIYKQPHNQGKGAAVRRGFQLSTGDAVVIQDADLEYDPAEFPKLLQPIVEDQADVVFGSRFIGESHRVLYFWHSLGNHVLTWLSNAFTNLNLTDMETCYKIFRGSTIRQMAPQLVETRFGIEPELTSRLAKVPGIRIYERPISYNGRTYAQGKKITWRDGFRALYCILKYR